MFQLYIWDDAEDSIYKNKLNMRELREEKNKKLNRRKKVKTHLKIKNVKSEFKQNIKRRCQSKG